MLSKQRLLTPGPTLLPERVRLAMAGDMLHHRSAQFMEIAGRVQEGLRSLFGTSQIVLPLASSGTGAMTAAAAAMFRPGEKVLVVQGGKFGERWTEICACQGLETCIMEVEPGQAAAAAEIADRLQDDPRITGVFIQHSETSTGVQHPVREIAAVTRNTDCLLVVDGVSAVSITPCPMDEWGIDCLLTGSQKGLMLPPGLALVALSQRAWKKAEGLPCQNYYFDLLKERKNCEKREAAYTTPVAHIIGLDEVFRMFSEFGMEGIYRKQWALTMMARKGVEALGLELFAKTHFAWGLTSLLLPEGVDAPALLAHASARYGVTMVAGQDAWKNRMVRIGHMGWLDYADLAAGLHALEGSFTACGGYIGSRNYLEQALNAYWTALEQGYPGD